ncbi:unnamed protein product [Rhizophagus irregularis]|uniref:Uncharacterized protein n=1 Tax=Rhizophagus irregularis TaxID=588596 RepID=A0A2N1NIT2_9GLOM|nr:hypothetical protein RhiirC2_864277 [Rhizophagus irregularis]CAB4393232.1 unnamed protein product [Rhizophagus irregularis]CAB5366751.1 unnamed protein product [Rhizophagus irregularis]
MLFYDIPVRYSDTDVVAAIKQLGTVHRIRIKKHYKYQSVRADISLLEDYEKSFLNGAWKEKIVIGSEEKYKKVIDIRWFHGDKTVKDIKEKCKWKAYKVIRTSYYHDIARQNFTFEYGKTACFGKKQVFSAYFKDKKQLEAALHLDKSMDNKWILHGSRQEGEVKIASKEVTAKSLVSTSPIKQHNVTPHNQVKATPTTVISTTEEVVDTVNKYRKDLLDEMPISTVSAPIKDYTSPDNVVKVIEEYRKESLDGMLIDLSTPTEKTHSIDNEMKKLSNVDRIMMEYRNTNKELDKKKIEKFKKDSDKQTKKEKTVSPVELHEFAKVNAECSERLQKERERSYTLSNNNPFVITEDGKSHLSASSDDDECLKDVKKRIKKKQGARSSDSEEDLTIDGSNEVKVNEELQLETNLTTNKTNKTPPEGFSRVFRKGRSRTKK